MNLHQQVKVLGANGQISLGKEFAGKTILIDKIAEGTWSLRRVDSFLILRNGFIKAKAWRSSTKH